MQIESNKSNNIKYFSSDENSIIEKEIEKAAKDNFPFFKERNENEIVTDLMEEEDNREVIFKVNTLKKKRGRKPKNPNKKKKIHSASSQDNSRRKINSHFLNFIIFVLNNIAFSFLNNKKPIFKKFDYEQKK